MLPIRPNQFDVFQAVQQDEFAVRMAAHLRAHAPDKLPPEDAALRKAILAWTEDAKGWGIELEPDVERYLELCAEFPDLRMRPAPPWAADILKRRARLPEERLRDLEIECFFGHRTDAPQAD